MSSLEVGICLKFVEMRFGQSHKDVASQMSDYLQGITLGQLVDINRSKYTIIEIKNILVELLQYGYIEYIQKCVDNKSTTNKVSYKLAVEYVIAELWHTQFSHYVGIKYGYIAKIVALHLLKFGVVTIERLVSHLVIKVDISIDNIIHVFRNLSNDRIIIYHKNWLKDNESGLDLIDIDIDENADRLCYIHTDETTLQELRKEYEQDTNKLSTIISRKRRISDGLSIEQNIPFMKRLVCVNYNALTLLLQNELIKEYASSCFDNISANIIGSILEYDQENRTLYASQSLPVSFYQILRHMNKYNVTEDDLRYYLTILQGEDYHQALIKTDDHKMGEYSVNIKSIFKDYVEKSMHIIVSHKYGSYAGRICKMVLHYKYMDPKQISHLCLIDINETQSLLQKLCKDEFLGITLIPKGIETRPLKSVCIIHANIDKIASVLKLNCIQFIDNLLVFRRDLTQKNQNIIEKGEKLYKIVEQVKTNHDNSNNMVDQQEIETLLQDQTNIMSDGEKKTYDHIQLYCNKVDISLAKLSQQYFVIKYYLKIIHSQP